MPKNTSDEREFSQNIDRLIAGEVVKASEDTSDDYRVAIEFAQRMVSLRSDPSSHFKDQLKQRLLQKLIEQEAELARKKAKGNWFWEALRSLAPQNPVWRAATATVVVVILAVVVLWGSGIFMPAPQPEGLLAPAPSMAPPTQTLLSLEVISVKTTAYLPGDEVKIDLAWQNISPESITIARFPPAIQITQAETGEVIRSFIEGNEEAEIPASGTLKYTFVWDQRDDNGHQVGPGRYSIVINDVVLHSGIPPTESHQDFGYLTDVTIQSP